MPSGGMTKLKKTKMFLLKDDSFQVRKTKNKGFGVFAKKAIKKGTIISDYLGKVIKTADYNLDLDKNGLYLMYLTDQAAVYPNPSGFGPHLINHSCEPNCWIYTYCGHTLFFATRDIKAGEELTISYLLSPNCSKSCTHACRCASKFCTGTMHLSEKKYKLWQKFQERQKTKITKVIFGKDLPRLASYPAIKAGDPIYATIDKVVKY